MKKIKAEIVADSINPQGDGITTYLLTLPRFILAELNTHRVFSKNSASSRAIPFEKMVKMVQEDPFIPIAWQKNHKGMQGTEYETHLEHIKLNNIEWLEARDSAVDHAKVLNNAGCVTKQLCNRLLEPFMWHTVLLTGTEFKNFFELRCPKYIVNNYTPTQNKTKIFYSRKDVINFVKEDGIKHGWESCEEWDEVQWQSINNSQAEIHMQALAEAMWDAYNESTPKELKPGEWHIPFGDNFDKREIDKFAWITNKGRNLSPIDTEIAVASARCARLSYMTFDGEIDYEKDIKLHDSLLKSGHMSPFEHCARAMSEEEYYSFIKGGINTVLNNGRLEYEVEDFQKGWCNNFKGFIQYRYLIENDYD